MPEVKKFINEDLPFYHDVTFKAKPGANPDLLLLNAADEIVERIDLGKYNRETCNGLLKDLGFFRKEYKDQEPPENLVYKTRDEL